MANNRHVPGKAANQIIKRSKSDPANHAFPNLQPIARRAALMADRVNEFLSQANRARERAASTDGDFKRQWLKVAEMWELLAKEYQRIWENSADT
ncbi:MAG TPA: hypothetical protein VKR31_11955 [Rhizomicrobium sp.]|nr:hypothetical protein [Rhizomicrobium sp.]